MRNSEIYVSAEIKTKLYWAARAQAAKADAMDSRVTADSIAEELLKEGLDKHYPTLSEFYKQRQAIDDNAIKSL